MKQTVAELTSPQLAVQMWLDLVPF